MDNWLEHEARYQYGAWPAAHHHRLLSLTRCDGRYGLLFLSYKPAA